MSLNCLPVEEAMRGASLEVRRGRPTHFRTDDLGPLDHGQHLAEGDIAREVFHPAVGGDDDVFGRHVGKRPSDARCHNLRRLDVHVRQVNDAEQDFLAAEFGERGAVELGLGGFDRDLAACPAAVASTKELTSFAAVIVDIQSSAHTGSGHGKNGVAT